MGTAAYPAPEQARGGEIAPPLDVYALGLVFLACLTAGASPRLGHGDGAARPHG